jgi:hypothetical protein
MIGVIGAGCTIVDESGMDQLVILQGRRIAQPTP